jgi:hypothetical protein
MTEEREISRGEAIQMDEKDQYIKLTPEYEKGVDGFGISVDAKCSTQVLAAGTFTLLETLLDNTSEEERVEIKSLLKETVKKYD